MENPNTRTITLTEEEKKIFAALIRMELVHNILGQKLGEFKDQIMDYRNKVVADVSQRHRLEKPREWMYDANRQELVSVFNPNVATHTTVETSGLLVEAARQELSDVISKLTKIAKNTKIQ